MTRNTSLQSHLRSNLRRQERLRTSKLQATHEAAAVTRYEESPDDYGQRIQDARARMIRPVADIIREYAIEAASTLGEMGYGPHVRIKYGGRGIGRRALAMVGVEGYAPKYIWIVTNEWSTYTNSSYNLSIPDKDGLGPILQSSTSYSAHGVGLEANGNLVVYNELPKDRGASHSGFSDWEAGRRYYVSATAGDLDLVGGDPRPYATDPENHPAVQQWLDRLVHIDPQLT